MKISFILGVSAFICSVGFAQQTTRDTLFNVESKFFSENREFSVHLPEDYSSNDTLPVIYFFDAQWKPFENLVNSTIDYLTAIGAIEKSIVVGIFNVNRQYELTPEPINEDWKMPSLGGAHFLENHLLQEVIPTIERNYATTNYRTGIGHSLGGTFVLNCLVDAPNLFDAYIAISPNLQLDEEEIALKLIRNSENLQKSEKFVYATMGTEGNPDNDFLPSLQKLDSVLIHAQSPMLSWKFDLLEGLSHATTPLKSIYEGLILLEQNRLSKTTSSEEKK